jgi:hypothetical protein
MAALDEDEAMAMEVEGPGGTEQEPGDLAAGLEDDRYYHEMGGDDQDSDEDEKTGEDLPEMRVLNMEPLPDHNIPDYEQENGLYMSGKRYVRSDKMPLDRFMELANITSCTNLDDHDIVFPELYESYS